MAQTTAVSSPSAGSSAHPIKFGTDGWRAVIAEGFTFQNVERVTRGIAEYVKSQFGTEKPVAIGYDSRFLADRFAWFSAHILKSQGIRPLLIPHFLPTPMVAFMAKAYDTAGAMMFTASHNPPEYCGIKFIPHYAGPATPEITEALLAKIQAVPESLCLGRPSDYDHDPFPDTLDPTEKYLSFVTERVKPEVLKQRPLKILHDPMYGAAQEMMQTLFKQVAGYGIDQIHNYRDTLFGGRIPEPTGEHLNELAEAVRSGGYDLGIANDGDADRIGILDEKGEFYPNNWIMPLLFRYLYQRHGMRGSVVRTVSSSMIMDTLADKYGVKVHETKVGFKYVGDLMRQEPVILGGEESGGLSILGHIPEKDGLLAALLVAEMMADAGKPLSVLLDEMFEEIGFRLHQKTVNIHLSESGRAAALDALKGFEPGQTLASFPIQQVNRMDGVKLVFDTYDWLLLRPSGTEPILRFYAESPDPKRLETYYREVQQLIGMTP